MTIIGIDPGSARCGYGIIQKDGAACRAVAFGCIETERTPDVAMRLRELEMALEVQLKKYKPTEAAVEELYFFKNPKTVIRVAEARGVVLATLARHGIAVYAYTPLQVKQAVSAYGRAGKAQVGAMVAKILGLKAVPRPDDAADALAVALCHSALPEAYKALRNK